MNHHLIGCDLKNKKSGWSQRDSWCQDTFGKFLLLIAWMAGALQLIK
jgi:hypothetical protein